MTNHTVLSLHQVSHIPGGPKKWHPFQLCQYNAW